MKNLIFVLILHILLFSCGTGVSEDFMTEINAVETQWNEYTKTADNIRESLNTESNRWNTLVADMKFELDERAFKPTVAIQADSLVKLCYTKSSRFGEYAGELAVLRDQFVKLSTDLSNLKEESNTGKIRGDIAQGKLDEIKLSLETINRSVQKIEQELQEAKAICENAALAFNTALSSEGDKK